MAVKRSYSSAKREEQARETRRSILDAAHDLFIATGYAATTIQAIADRAGVAVQTVYAVFGNKRELLRQLIGSIYERVAPIVRVASEAAASDPELAAVMEAVKAARREEMVASARILAGPQGLRTSSEEAAATLYVLYSPQVADMLVLDYGWTPDRYQKWLARMLLDTVIA
jgi:AcrR family transcriptional regulator